MGDEMTNGEEYHPPKHVSFLRISEVWRHLFDCILL